LITTPIDIGQRCWVARGVVLLPRSGLCDDAVVLAYAVLSEVIEKNLVVKPVFCNEKKYLKRN
jgi:acetyltransferase-like isoleucine patch superfamily enzyme